MQIAKGNRQKFFSSKVSDGAYDKQRSLLGAERRWIVEERERIRKELARLEQQSVSLVSIGQLRGQVEQKLASTEFADRRFVLEALGTGVLVTTEGSIEVEFAIPTERPKCAIAYNTSFSQKGILFIQFYHPTKGTIVEFQNEPIFS